MSDDTPDKKPSALKFDTRDWIYGIVLVVGFGYLFSGLNGALGWGLGDAVTTAIGAVIGVAAAIALTWLRKR